MIILDLLYSANFVLKKRNVPIQKQKRKTKKKLIKSFKKSFFDIEILKTFFLFLYFKQKRNETKFFFRGAIKNELFDHKKNETLTSLLWNIYSAAEMPIFWAAPAPRFWSRVRLLAKRAASGSSGSKKLNYELKSFLI